MRSILIVLAACSLSACASISPFAVDTKATAEAQKIQADAKAAIDAALAARLDHCRINGSLTLSVGMPAILSGSNTLGVDCDPKPWSLGQ